MVVLTSLLLNINAINITHKKTEKIPHYPPVLEPGVFTKQGLDT